MLVRKGVSTEAAEADVEVYAEGVRRLRKRSQRDERDPLGWTYQSRIHGNPRALPRRPGEPSDWSQCQHGSWWFLPWHRMYLLQFERIIRSVTGEPDWALPYWDYATPGRLKVPPAFRKRTSPLFDPTRALRRPSSIATVTWPETGTFTAFGGASRTSPAHLGEAPGALELSPHNIVHGLVGGDMAGFQSPLDPLFWIHHCNIDRLWEVWLTLANDGNPTDGAWVDTTFEFPDPESGRRRLRVGDVLTAEAAGYSYDDLAPPTAETRAMTMLPPMAGSRRDDRLELLGATSGSGSVGDRIEIAVDPGAVGRRRDLASRVGDEEAGGQPPLFLRLENVGMDSGDASSMWNIYVRTATSDRHLVGTIAPFGLAGLTTSGGRQTITFDVSSLADELLGADAIEVTFEPAHDEVEGRPYWERAGLYTTAE